MKKSLEMRQQHSKLVNEMEEIVNRSGEGFSDDDEKRYTELETQADTLEKEIDRMEKLEERKRKLAIENGQAVHTGVQGQRDISQKDKKDAQTYSWLRAIRIAAGREKFEGIEAEMHDEGKREFRNQGLNADNGGVIIPSHVLTEKRDVTATGGSSGDQGGVAIQTELGSFIDALRARTVLAQLGADFQTGLVGNIDFPAENAVFTPTWEGENDAAAESSPTFTKKSITPKRLAGYVDVSKQLMIQTSPSIEARIRRQIVQGTAEAIDTAGINGSGSAPVPEGILNTSGIGDVAGGTNGLAPTWAHILELEGKVRQANALGNFAYLTNEKIRETLKGTVISSNTAARHIWDVGASTINGYNVQTTTLVPSNLDKGSSTGVCSAIIFGNFQELMIGQWGGIEIMPDPYTQAVNGLVRMHLNLYADVLVMQPAAFAAMKDALTS